MPRQTTHWLMSSSRILLHGSFFTDPSVPWERTVGPTAGGVEFNSTPWLAVLTFTENELLRSKDELSALGDLGPQSHYGTFTALAGKVKAASQQGTITTVMDSVSYGKDYQDSDFLAFITMPAELFQDLFADYTSGQKNWSGTPDLRRYSYMAHVREVHGGFMASTTQEKAQIQTSFVDAVAALGRNVQPLRVPDQDLQAFSQPDDPSKSDDSPLAASKRWLVEKLKSGYIVLPHTTITGEKVNNFLATPIATGPRRGSRPQVPKWGFFLRSMAVTAFPDLKIEVPLPSGSEIILLLFYR
ncbi:hypothetical protein FOXB_08546 [Fusarium oxysporum f. sp. conglutinans Fo5176]|uniref:Uncharacterized protein n=1 Tax=Fusarium oxysporum (strain Fo5176) TaxID=660025 RepID=F9FQ66_FUSOF|nr:hypothetical protein FOXB_08546 [Fusarium oxysporum f. sp. conglutinans Fo5176]